VGRSAVEKKEKKDNYCLDWKKRGKKKGEQKGPPLRIERQKGGGTGSLDSLHEKNREKKERYGISNGAKAGESTNIKGRHGPVRGPKKKKKKRKKIKKGPKHQTREPASAPDRKGGRESSITAKKNHTSDGEREGGFWEKKKNQKTRLPEEWKVTKSTSQCRDWGKKRRGKIVGRKKKVGFDKPRERNAALWEGGHGGAVP